MKNINIKEPPLASYILLAYNQEKFIKQAVYGALNQDYENLEIIISDDCSQDSTYKIIKSIISEYTGSHKVIINRNQSNLGLVRHFNRVISEVHGDIIIVAAGDDISLPNRVSNSVNALITYPNIAFLSFTDIIIDENDKIISKKKEKESNYIKKISLNKYITDNSVFLSGASRAYKRIIFDFFGALNENCPTEDTTTAIRGLMVGDALLLPESGILYRKHNSNLSSQDSLNRMNFLEIKKQYIEDANLAYKSSIINYAEYRKIIEWAKKDYKKRILIKENYMKKNSLMKMLHYFSKIIPTNVFSIREKINLYVKSSFIISLLRSSNRIKHWYNILK